MFGPNVGASLEYLPPTMRNPGAGSAIPQKWLVRGRNGLERQFAVILGGGARCGDWR